MSFYYFYCLIFKKQIQRKFLRKLKSSWWYEKWLWTAFSLSVFSAKTCHGLHHLWGWKNRRSYCLLSTWLGQISGSCRKSPDREITRQDGNSFHCKPWRVPGGLGSLRLHVSRSREEEIWLIFLLLLMLTFKIIKFQRQGKDLEKVKQRLIEIANHVDKVSSFSGN